MEQESQKITFKGNILLFVKQGYVYSLPICLLLSFMIAGWNCFFHLFIFGLVLSLPGVFLLYIGSPLNRFSLDDKKKQIVKPLTRGISYHKVKAIYIVESGKLLDVCIRTGWLRRTFLAVALDIKQKQRVIEELAKRFPKEILHQRRFSTWKCIISIVLGFFLIHSIFLFYFYRKNPQLRVTPQIKSWIITRDLVIKGQKRYTFEGVAFGLPQGFKLVKEEEEKKLFFADEDKKTKIMVIPGLYKDIDLPQSKSLLFYGLGIKNSYGLFQTVYYARFGAIPLILKGIALKDLNEIKVYEIEKFPFRGFITQGTKDEKEFLDILLVDENKNSEINFNISSSEKLSEEILKIILGSVKNL